MLRLPLIQGPGQRSEWHLRAIVLPGLLDYNDGLGTLRCMPRANNEGNPKCAVETPGGRPISPMVQMRPTIQLCRR
jgi:hypothetical protein